ncbi:NAD(P)-dependent oxidoreductase [Microbacterium sp. NPDC089696]|uniref:NAD(P)-dependent oxidoreductase n=1 Tax=Microbacterium sp. NPDC089696 TaxID=3364199 RepID=UPI0037FB8894
MSDDVTVDSWAPGDEPGAWESVEFWVMPYVPFDFDAAISRMEGLRVIQLMTSGYERLLSHADRIPPDVTVCTARGIPDAAVSEWVLTAMVAMQRGLLSFIDDARQGVVHRAETHGLDGTRILVVGYGSVGRALQERLRGFDVELIKVGRHARDDVHGTEDLAALLPTADILVLLMPLTAQTRGMIDREALALLPDGALVVNAARGEVLDQEALVQEVASGRLRAALDVAVSDPPLPDNSPLLGLPNLALHVGRTSALRD